MDKIKSNIMETTSIATKKCICFKSQFFLKAFQLALRQPCYHQEAIHQDAELCFYAGS